MKKSHFTDTSAGAPIRLLHLVRPPIVTGLCEVVSVHRSAGKGHGPQRTLRVSQSARRIDDRMLKVMADNMLDAIVHKAVEHQPTLIKDGVNPPFVDQKGAPHLNTFLVFVPSIVVPAGFTRDNLPAGIAFLGRPYDDGNMIKFAYAYEQATHHRRPPASTTPL